MAEVKIADQDTFGIRKVGPESSVRVQIKKGDPIPADVELEGGSSTSKKSGAKGDDEK